MTTPERLRRRQRVESFLLIIVGLLMIAQYWVNDRHDDAVMAYWRAQNAAQDLCFAEQFRRVDDVLGKRSAIATDIYQNQQDYSTGRTTKDEYERRAAALESKRSLLAFPDYPPPGCPPLATGQEKRHDR